jgi:hypothetical protein
MHMATKPQDWLPQIVYVTVEDIRAARKVDAASVRAAHYLASRKAREAGDVFGGRALHDPRNAGLVLTPENDRWPKVGIPRPAYGRPLLRWDIRDERVVEYMSPPGTPEELSDFAWLHKHYVERQMTPAAMARLLDPEPSRDVVVLSLERIRRPDGGIGIPIREAGNQIALAAWTKQDLDSLMDRHGGVLARAAAEIGVTTMTLRRARRRAELMEELRNSPPALAEELGAHT